MAFQFNESDQELLVSIAEHRVLTIRHLTTLLQRNASALRRRLKILSAQGLIEVAGRPFGRSRGRPGERDIPVRGRCRTVEDRQVDRLFACFRQSDGAEHSLPRS